MLVVYVVCSIMNNPTIDFTRGELVGTARALLALHMDGTDALMFDLQCRELKRLVNNEFQLHGHELGCPVQFALTIILMNGHYHSASQRRSL